MSLSYIIHKLRRSVHFSFHMSTMRSTILVVCLVASAMGQGEPAKDGWSDVTFGAGKAGLGAKINPEPVDLHIEPAKPNDELPFQDVNVLDESQGTIPMDILQQVSEVKDSSQFVDKFLSESDAGILGSKLGEKDDGAPGSTILGRGGAIRPSKVGLQGSKIGLSGKIAQQALCTPSKQVIELAKNDDPFVLYYPTCTRINRCGGCCRSSLLACEAARTKKVTFQVIKTRYSNDRTKPFNLEALENVTVEEHTKCKCQCKIKARDCNRLQTYKANECRCECKNQNEVRQCRGSDKFWDSTQCACKCKNYQDQCSTSFRFSEKLCRCIPEEAFRIEEQGESDWLFGRTIDRRRLPANP